MEEAVWIQSRYESAYGLLGSMARGIRAGFVAKGIDARLLDLAHDAAPREGVFLFLNAPRDLTGLPPALLDPSGGLRAVQFFVDHPLAMPAPLLDAWAEHGTLSKLRVCHPCADDAHLFRMRWAGLSHAWVGHGVSRSDLCDPGLLSPELWKAREFDVVVTGSIAPEAELHAAIEGLAPDVASMVRDVASVMIAQPALGFMQAVDIVMGSAGAVTGEWDTTRQIWRLCVAIANRARRLRAVKALQGLRVGVFGSGAWETVCGGTVSYMGPVAYHAIAGAFARGRIGLAWGPTQFAHSYSERVMLSMAAGCCTVSDDRVLVRRDFCGADTSDRADPGGAADSVRVYDASDPGTLRDRCDALLACPDEAVALATRARRVVEERCLWEHRVGSLLTRSRCVTAAA